MSLPFKPMMVNYHQQEWDNIVKNAIKENVVDYNVVNINYQHNQRIHGKEKINRIKWKRSRRTKRQYLKRTEKKRIFLPNTNSKVSLSIVGISPILKNVTNFPKLLRMKKVLTEELFTNLRRIFQIVDTKKSGYICIDDVIRINVLLSHNKDIKEIKDDAQLLFSLCQNQTNECQTEKEEIKYLSEMQWLTAWTESVKNNNYSIEKLQKFVDSFNNIKDDTNMISVLKSDISKQVDHSVFLSIVRWREKIMEKIRIKNQKLLQEAEAKRMAQERVIREKEAKKKYSKMTRIWNY